MTQPGLGKKIAELRKAKGLTQEELTQQCHLNVRTLQRIENGEVVPRFFTVKAIFEALGSNMELLNEFPSAKEVEKEMLFSGLIKHVYQQLKEMFNLKQNTMKKISVFSVLALAIAIFVVGASMRSKERNSYLNQQLLGTWKNIAEYNNGAMVSVFEGRTMKFNKDQTFKSTNPNGSFYNGGIFSTQNDNLLVTIHFQNDRELSKTANYYNCSVRNDTLRFSGYYLRLTKDGSYVPSYVSEVWVRDGKKQ